MRGPVRIAAGGDLLPGVVAAVGFLLLVFGLQMALWLAVGLALCLYAGVWLLTRRPAAPVPETVQALKLVRQIGERSFRIPNPEVRKRVSRICEQGSRFSQFLQQGVGSFPIIVGYEAQLVEFGLENPQYGGLLHREVTTLYPKPRSGAVTRSSRSRRTGRSW